MARRRSSKSILELKRQVHELCGTEAVAEWPGEREPLEKDEWYDAMSRRLLLARLHGLERESAHVDARKGVLFDVSMLGVSAEDRLERALVQMSERFEVVSGLNEIWGWVSAGEVTSPDAPAWAREAYARGVELGKECEDERAARVLLGVWLSEHSEALDWLVRVSLWFTQSHARVRAHCWEQPWADESSTVETKSAVLARWRARAPEARMVSVPHGVLSTLPKEVRNVGAALNGSLTESLEASLKQIEQDGSKYVLSADRRLVFKDSDVGEAYLKLPVTEHAASAAGSLEPMALLTQQVLQIVREVGPSAKGRQLENMTRDIPRVVAGIFLAAAEDRNRVQVPGQFLDSVSGLRLAKITGLDHRQSRDLVRVRRVRELLTKIQFMRTIETFDPKTKQKTRVDWNTPIIQRMADEVVASCAKPEELEYVKSTLGVWLIAPKLWDMTQPRSQSSRFMLLDERAFGLDPNSGAFNLYWTIVQRAYNALRTSVPDDKFDASGRFAPKLETLYFWSGNQLKSHEKNPSLILSSMRSYLEEMVDAGIISDWSCSMIERGRYRQDAFEEERVKISMPSPLLGYLPDSAFVLGTNPYANSDRHSGQTSLFDLDRSDEKA